MPKLEPKGHRIPGHLADLAKELGVPEPDWYVGSAESGRTSRRDALEDAARTDETVSYSEEVSSLDDFEVSDF